MSVPSVWVFDRLDDAELARTSLLASGLSQQQLHVEAIADEAGPVQGNFQEGNSVHEPDGDSRHTYEHDYAKVENRGTFLLQVVCTPQQNTEASAIISRLGGRKR